MFGFKRLVNRSRDVVEPSTRLIRLGLQGFKQFLMRGNNWVGAAGLSGTGSSSSPGTPATVRTEMLGM